MKKSKKKKSFVRVEILQNGITIAECIKPLWKNDTITVSARANADLTIPFYPFYDAVELFKIEKTEVLISADPTWEGFITYRGQFTEVTSKTPPVAPLKLTIGDYGTIAWNDLSVLIKVGPIKESEDLRLDKEYQGSIFSLFFDNPANIAHFFVAIFLAATLISSSVFYLLHVDRKPLHFNEIAEDYLIAIIHPEHYATLPEAMQEHLDRSNMSRSAINYYGSYTGNMFGFRVDDHNLLMSSTAQMLESMNMKQQQKIENTEDDHHEAIARVLAEKFEGSVSFPTVKGESLNSSILRAQDKIIIMHKSFDSSLKNKEKIKQIFCPGGVSEKYEEGDDDSPTKECLKGGLAKLDQINVLYGRTNEQVMYDTAASMQRRAKNVQDSIAGKTNNYDPLTQEIARPITIDPSIINTSFIPMPSLASLNGKLTIVRASEFGQKKELRVKEPLVGMIKPDLVESVISKNKFDLQLCFELALRRNEKLTGSMGFKWRLDSKGEISDILLTSTSIGDRQMERCILKKIASWKFPPPTRGSVEINHLFSFRPARG